MSMQQLIPFSVPVFTAEVPVNRPYADARNDDPVALCLVCCDYHHCTMIVARIKSCAEPVSHPPPRDIANKRSNQWHQ